METKIAKNLHFIIIGLAVYFRYVQFGEISTEVNQKNQEIVTLTASKAKKQKDAADLEVYLEDLEENEAELAAMQKEIEEFQKKLPEKIKDIEMLDHFSSEAELLNIKDISLKPLQKTQMPGGYLANAYAFQGEGTFLQFLVYFERIGKDPKPIDVGNVTLSLLEGDQKGGRFQLVSLSATITVFSYNVPKKPVASEGQGEG